MVIKCNEGGRPQTPLIQSN